MQAPAHVQASPTAQRLGLAEIESAHPNEWVALIDVDAADMKIASGVVFAHHADRDTLRAMARSLTSCAILFTGRVRPWRPPVLADRVSPGDVG